MNGWARHGREERFVRDFEIGTTPPSTKSLHVPFVVDM